METVRLRAVAYITGGFYENIPRSLPDGLSAKIHREDVRVLPTFDEIARAGEISDRDMFNTFNMEEAEWQILSLAAEQAARRLMMEKEAMSNAYRIDDLGQLLSENAYPGRGIVIGQTETTGKAVTAYFIMGRSENSRNRVFALKDGELFAEPFDPSKVVDPSLIIYAALRTAGDKLVVTNGDQTDTIVDFLKEGKTFEEALLTRQFEPDYPHLTPRISGMVSFDPEEETGFMYTMSILKSEDPEGGRCGRYTFDYEPEAGLGHFLHTYACDGNPLPSFCGEPERVAVSDDIDEFTDLLWRSLNPDNKVALYVRYTDPKDRSFEDRMANRHGE